MTEKQSRREFVRKAGLLGAGLSLSLANAASYGRILGANDRINFVVAGIRGRGMSLAESAVEVGQGISHIAYLCDVDSDVLAEKANVAERQFGYLPLLEKDFRKTLDDKDVDAVIIATPDHTHTPFSIYAMQADKHVYVEKPFSHNPYEGELLVKAQKKYGKVVQVGNQQRSAPTSMLAIKDIREGIIGRPYMAKTWYSRNRGPIGVGNKVAVPYRLDWQLWQGPAPRRDYKDNIVHYNWHWFWHWGTGEINNNGLHEIDICRWALDVDYPLRVSSKGGRFHYKDDWEFYDTQVASFEYEGNKMITWEGRSCNNFLLNERDRGAIIYGTDGTVMVDRNGYFLYDRDGTFIKLVNEKVRSGTTDLIGAGPLVNFHIENFISAIRDGATLNSPVDEAHKSTLTCHLGNIAQKFDRTLSINPKNGRINNDRKAMSLWRREYQPGWEPKV